MNADRLNDEQPSTNVSTNLANQDVGFGDSGCQRGVRWVARNRNSGVREKKSACQRTSVESLLPVPMFQRS